MTTVPLAYANLDFGRSLAAQRADVEELYRRAIVVALLECKVNLHGTAAHVAQPARLREAIMSHRRLIRQGSTRSTLNRVGLQIGDRRFVWAVPDLGTGLPRTAVIAAHMPPLRFRRLLYPLYKARLVALVARHRAIGRQVIVFTDANARFQKDPIGLRRKFGGRLYGHRIDGVWLSPGIARHVVRYHEESRPGRTDGHPFIWLTLNSGRHTPR